MKIAVNAHLTFTLPNDVKKKIYDFNIKNKQKTCRLPVKLVKIAGSKQMRFVYEDDLPPKPTRIYKKKKLERRQPDDVDTIFRDNIAEECLEIKEHKYKIAFD